MLSTVTGWKRTDQISRCVCKPKIHGIVIESVISINLNRLSRVTLFILTLDRSGTARNASWNHLEIANDYPVRINDNKSNDYDDRHMEYWSISLGSPLPRGRRIMMIVITLRKVHYSSVFWIVKSIICSISAHYTVDSVKCNCLIRNIELLDSRFASLNKECEWLMASILNNRQRISLQRLGGTVYGRLISLRFRCDTNLWPQTTCLSTNNVQHLSRHWNSDRLWINNSIRKHFRFRRNG